MEKRQAMQDDKVDRMEVGCRWYVFYNDKFIRVWLWYIRSLISLIVLFQKLF